MIDTGSSGAFLNESIAKQRNLIIFTKQRTIPLANNKQHADIIGEVNIDIVVNRVKHEKVAVEVVEVIKDLCSEIIIGRDVLGGHSRVLLNFSGPRKELAIGTFFDQVTSTLPTPTQPLTTSAPPRASTFCAMNIPPPPFFTYLSPDIKPVATKSRRLFLADSAVMPQKLQGFTGRV